MGLAEKRLAESIKTDKLVTFEKKISDIAGYHINVEIDWETFTNFDANPLNRLVTVMFESVESVLKKICSDEMGKQALKDGLSTIHLINTNNFDSLKMELKDKNLYLTFQLAGDSYGTLTDSQIVTYIENSL